MPNKVGEKILRPPSLSERANSLLSRSLGDTCPVRAGINLVLIKSSKGAKKRANVKGSPAEK